jgi:ATP-dependent RNA helicase DeaD
MESPDAASGKPRRKTSRKPTKAKASPEPAADPITPAESAPETAPKKPRAAARSSGAVKPASRTRRPKLASGDEPTLELPSAAPPAEARPVESPPEPDVVAEPPARSAPPSSARQTRPAGESSVVWDEPPPTPKGVTLFAKPAPRVVPTRIDPPPAPPTQGAAPAVVTVPADEPAPVESLEGAAVEPEADDRPPVPIPPPDAGFDAYALSPELLKACEAAGFKTPSEIQRRLIPLALAGRDVLGQSKTGSGKTAAFLLPILQQLKPDAVVQALILVPTRELCLQVQQECAKLTKFAPVKTAAILGGHAMGKQLDDLRRGAKLVVGTPGRILDHLSRGTLRLHDIGFVVLDEVDRMLDIGFRDDIRRILGRVQGPHQTVFVSATISDEIGRLAAKYMRRPERVFLAPDDLTVPQVEQLYVSVGRHDKYRLLKMLLRHEQPKAAIIFCATKRMADMLAEKMDRDGLNAAEIHGDLEQRRREAVLGKFRRGQVTYLVATDLASRGLDIPEVSHIINYDVPQDVEGYVHRIGRTARMGATGKAVTLATREEGSQLTDIEKFVNKLLHPFEVPGFVASPAPPPREQPVQVARPPAISRFKQTVFWDTESPAGPVIKAPAKTLGAKFPPARKRRR